MILSFLLCMGIACTLSSFSLTDFCLVMFLFLIYINLKRTSFISVTLLFFYVFLLSFKFFLQDYPALSLFDLSPTFYSLNSFFYFYLNYCIYLCKPFQRYPLASLDWRQVSVLHGWNLVDYGSWNRTPNWDIYMRLLQF